MAQLIVRNSDGDLEISNDSAPGVFDQEVVYRSDATKTLSIENGSFVETEKTGRASRILFPTDR